MEAKTIKNYRPFRDDEELIRKERKRKETRACKDKLFELSYKELKQK